MRGLQKAFLSHTGSTPGMILRAARIEHAKNLLSNWNRPLREILPHVGYRSLNSFFVAFKAATGMSPFRFSKKRMARRCRN